MNNLPPAHWAPVVDRESPWTTFAPGLRVCGVDEAGRGPLAGSVVAAAVILDPHAAAIVGLRDSKCLSTRQREHLARKIKDVAQAWAVGVATVEEIDDLNILQASLLAMKRAITALSPVADAAWIDGNQLPSLALPMQAIVGGDARVPAISAASILAKVCRDGMMRVLHESYPHYGFTDHYGYPTPKHLRLLAQYGPCPLHRRSFAPVAAALRRLTDS